MNEITQESSISAVTRFEHLLGLTTLAVALPIFDLISNHTTFLVAHLVAACSVLLSCIGNPVPESHGPICTGSLERIDGFDGRG